MDAYQSTFITKILQHCYCDSTLKQTARSLTHNADEDISEDIRSNEDPEDDVESREEVVAHASRVLVDVEPVIQCE